MSEAFYERKTAIYFYFLQNLIMIDNFFVYVYKSGISKWEKIGEMIPNAISSIIDGKQIVSIHDQSLLFFSEDYSVLYSIELDIHSNEITNAKSKVIDLKEKAQKRFVVSDVHGSCLILAFTGDLFVIKDDKADRVLGWNQRLCEELGKRGLHFKWIRYMESCDYYDKFIANICTNEGDVFGVFDKNTYEMEDIINPGIGGTNHGVSFWRGCLWFQNIIESKSRIIQWDICKKQIKQSWELGGIGDLKCYVVRNQSLIAFIFKEGPYYLVNADTGVIKSGSISNACYVAWDSFSENKTITILNSDECSLLDVENNEIKVYQKDKVSDLSKFINTITEKSGA